MRRPGEPTGAPRALPELEPLLGELVAAGASSAAGHPPPGVLTAYHRGRLSAAEEAAVQDHLAACPDCSAVILDLAAFEAAAAADGAPAAADLADATAWRALAPHLAAERGDGRRPIPSWAWAVAASLLVAAPLALLLARGERRTEELRRALATPQTAVPVLYLDSIPRDDGLDAAELTLPAGDGFFLLAVTPAAAAERHRVEILDAAGRTVWRDDAVPPSDHGTLRLGFTRRVLPSGRYRLTATPVDGAGEPTGFAFTLRDPA